MATIILTSFTSFRQAFYETFFHIHFALAALILAALCIHLDGLPQLNYLIAVTAIWATERLLRLLSLLYSNVGPTTTTVSIEVLPGDAMRVHVRLARPRPIKPGQYIFLTIPSIGLWTSHPFSIAWSETLPQRPHRYTDPEKGYLTPSPTTPSTFNHPSTSISLLIRRRSGFTSRLHSKATNSPTPHLTLRALISSPHGSPHPLTSYGTTILIAGGIGITAFLPRIQHLLSAHASHTTATRRISLVWIIRSPEHLEWIRPWMSTILAMPHRRDVLRIQLFVTRPRDGREVRSPSATVSMCPGKPNVEALVGREIAGGLGAVGVGVCGPGGLRDGVRGAVRGWCGRRNVDFWEEGFGW